MQTDITYDSASSKVKAYRVVPENARAAVILIHEIWGLNDNIRSIADRLAGEGYSVLAPNLYSAHEALNSENIGKVMSRVWSIPQEKRGDPEMYKSLAETLSKQEREVVDLLVLNRQPLENEMITHLKSAYNFLSGEKVVSMGFCMGGGLAFQLATEVKLAGSVIFYGRNPQPLESIAKISGPVITLYAGDDPAINSGIPEMVGAMIKHGKDLELKVYPGTNHAFFNETGRTYNSSAATDAWIRVKNFLRRILP
ncbi:MAG: dienelactone hydrolase family protein [Nitrososphaerota archaeon]|nr:dienelactone hydrolase family protein [Nitrososphaerota archaeon]